MTSARQPFTHETLATENTVFQSTVGVSENNRHSGFEPAFYDTVSGAVYRSCFADGRPAPVHLLDGLPEELVVSRSACGKVYAVKDSVISGFIRDTRFFTRQQLTQALL